MLNKKQKKCLELMACGEFKQKEVADMIKVTEQTICNWKKDSEFMGELESLIKVSIQSLAAKALKTQAKLLDAKSETVRYMVAKDILDRAGFKPDNNINLNVEPVILKDDLKE